MSHTNEFLEAFLALHNGAILCERRLTSDYEVMMWIFS